jgi:hypothetical protein
MLLLLLLLLLLLQRGETNEEKPIRVEGPWRVGPGVYMDNGAEMGPR